MGVDPKRPLVGFALVAVLFGVTAFVLESFLFHRVDVQTFLLGRPEPAEGVRLWAFNQGFYSSVPEKVEA